MEKIPSPSTSLPSPQPSCSSFDPPPSPHPLCVSLDPPLAVSYTPLIPSFTYMKDLTQLISGISIVYTDMHRYIQYCDESQSNIFRYTFSYIRRAHRYVPAVREKIIANCLERANLLNERSWEIFKDSMINIFAGKLECHEQKYMESQYVLTYTNLQMVQEQLTRVKEFSPIYCAIQGRNLEKWNQFLVVIPQVIKFCTDNWRSCSPHNTHRVECISYNWEMWSPDEKPPLQAWADKLNFFKSLIEEWRAAGGEMTESSSDSEDGEDEGRMMPREQRRRILSVGRL